MTKLGELGLQAIEAGKLHLMARLYWHVVEFGLTREEGVLKAFGAGLTSSCGETLFDLNSFEPLREPFNVASALAAPYRSDAFQPHYFVIEDMSQLLRDLAKLRW